MIKNLIIIIITLLIYGGVGWVMSIGWPKTCKPGQTASYNDPVETDDTPLRDCEGKWTHDYENKEKWTQNVIDICTSGTDKNCWGEEADNSVVVQEILENSSSCQTYIGQGETKDISCKLMMDAIKENNPAKLSEYNLSEPTLEQRQFVIDECQDCEVSLYIDTIADKDVYEEERSEDCLVLTPSNLSNPGCWGPCHGTCGQNGNNGIRGRKWKKDKHPGTGGQQCPTYVPEELLPPGESEFTDTEACHPDSCPGCCQTNSNKQNETCNVYSGGSSGKVGCDNTEYTWPGASSSPASDLECRWSQIVPDTGKIFGDAEATCNFLDVTWKNEGNVVNRDSDETIDDQLIPLNCIWTDDPDDDDMGICLPKPRDIDNNESLTIVRGDVDLGNFGGGAFYNDDNSQVNNEFEDDQQLSNLLSVSRTGWDIVNSDDTECGTYDDYAGCSGNDECEWHQAPTLGTCSHLARSGQTWSSHHTKEMNKMCKKQHVINSLIQRQYSKQSGECVFDNRGIRISLTGIPHSTTANATDVNEDWLWNHFDKDGSKTLEAAKSLKSGGGKAYNNSYPTYKLVFSDGSQASSTDLFVQKHPVIDGSEGLGHVMTNHSFVYLPVFRVTGLGTFANKTTELVKIKDYLRSPLFKDSKGYKIVVSNIDEMLSIDNSGYIIYNTQNAQVVNSDDPKVMMDEKKCMVENSTFDWSTHNDGDHPVINGSRWKPNTVTISESTALNNRWNCSDREDNNTDDAVTITSLSKWNETADVTNDDGVEIPKFSGFMRSSKFSNVQPQVDGAAVDVWNSHATKRIHKVAGVRCRPENNDEKNGKTKCFSKIPTYTDFENNCDEDESDCYPCPNNSDATSCNNQRTINPMCKWVPFESQMTDDEAKGKCSAGLVE